MKYPFWICTALALKTVVQPSAPECIVLHANPHSHVVINYEALPNADSVVGVTYKKQKAPQASPHDEDLPSIKPSRLGTLNLTQYITAQEEDTHFHVCFHCPAKVGPVELLLSVMSDPYEYAYGLATTSHTEALLHSVRELSVVTKEVYNQQQFAVQRTRAHREALKQSHGRMKTWRIIQALGVAGFVFSQMWYVRHVFSIKKALL